MAWRIVKITIELELVGQDRATPSRAQVVLEGQALKKYIGIGWGKITAGLHKGRHIFDPRIFAPPGTKLLAKSATASSEAFQLKEPNCSVKDWP